MPIRKPIQTITKQSLIYGIGNFANKFVAILLIPVITRYLSLKDVGFVAIIEMVDVLLVSILMLGMANALLRFLPDKTDGQQSEIISSIFWGRLFVDMMIAGGFILISNTLVSWIGFPARYHYLAPLIVINAFFTVQGRFLLTLWRFHQHPQRFIVLSLTQFVGSLILSTYFIVIREHGVEGIVYARMIVYGISTFATIGFVLKKYTVFPSAAIFKMAQRFGYPLIPMVFVVPFLTTSDRFFLNQFVSLEQIGIYSIGYKFGMLINILLVTPMQLAWIPMMYKMGLEEDSKKYYRDFIFYYTLVVSGIWVFITLFREEFIQVFATPEYLDGAKFIPFIGAAYLINGYRHFFIAGSALKDKTLQLGLASVVGIICNICLNYILIKHWGVWGAAVSTILSYMILVLLIYFVSHRQEPINWGGKPIFGVISWSLIFLLLAEQGIQYLPFNTFVLNIALMFVFVFSLKLLGFIGPREINGVRSLFTMVWDKFFSR